MVPRHDITNATARVTLAALLAVKEPKYGSYADAFQNWCEEFCWTLDSPQEEWTEDEKITAYLNNDPAKPRDCIGVTKEGYWCIHNAFAIEVTSMTFVEAVINEYTPLDLYGEGFFESIDD